MTIKYCDCCYVQQGQNNPLLPMFGMLVTQDGSPCDRGELRPGEVCKRCHTILLADIAAKFTVLRETAIKEHPERF